MISLAAGPHCSALSAEQRAAWAKKHRESRGPGHYKSRGQGLIFSGNIQTRSGMTAMQ
ncbi:hypothetical protein Vi05172_g177 [Venturia inaequalis]|nr:hypothetical protein Vi05172_g177 [Venturia inaequalis]